MKLLWLPFTLRFIPITASVLLFGISIIMLRRYPEHSAFLVIPVIAFGILSLWGLRDFLQTKHSILRNYPLAAQLRFLLERIRPEMRQYFFEGEKDGTPFSRDQRSIVYQRAKLQLDKRPFGTQYNVYNACYEWLNHSACPRPVSHESFRTLIGGPECEKPYSASVFNISGMSFGAISPNAIMALNSGARKGNFAHTTGEGGISRYHRENGGDLIWQIGSGYFGCRNEDGSFCERKYADNAKLEAVRMIEIKLSQGAKPGHGGVLPKVKISAEIAEARGIARDRDCISPAAHSAFSTPLELMQFIRKLRELSEGKPIGLKLCAGHGWEFLAICKAMLETSISPDFIVVDGAEGGTGAAPLEFTDHVGMPLLDGLPFVHNCLVGTGLRERIKLGASGKIISAFDMARVMALGADYCNSARGYMFALGCIQSQQCHTDKCPTGVATQDPYRGRALVVPDKSERVYNFHKATIEALAELVAAVGLDHPGDLKPFHLSRRVSCEKVCTFEELYPQLEKGILIKGTSDVRFTQHWKKARADSFAPSM